MASSTWSIVYHVTIFVFVLIVLIGIIYAIYYSFTELKQWLENLFDFSSWFGSCNKIDQWLGKCDKPSDTSDDCKAAIESIGQTDYYNASSHHDQFCPILKQAGSACASDLESEGCSTDEEEGVLCDESTLPDNWDPDNYHDYWCNAKIESQIPASELIGATRWDYCTYFFPHAGSDCDHSWHHHCEDYCTGGKY